MEETYYNTPAAMAAEVNRLCDYDHSEQLTKTFCACGMERSTFYIHDITTGELSHKLVLCSTCAARIEHALLKEAPNRVELKEMLEFEIKFHGYDLRDEKVRSSFILAIYKSFSMNNIVILLTNSL
ncbi:MAG: hypothetical protein WCO63_15545 [Bacteroidota bacterium]